MALTDVQIRNSKPKDKQYKLSDSQGLYLLIKPNGSKLWHQKYRFDKREKLLSYGAYPTVSLADARKKCEEAKALLKQGIDPSLKKQQEKMVREVGETFKQVSMAWCVYQGKASDWSDSYAHQVKRAIEIHLLPSLGNRLLMDITTQDLIIILKKVERNGYIDLANRLKNHLVSIMRHALHNQIIKYNPALDLDGVIQPPKTQHYPALDLHRLPEFFERLARYSEGRARKLTVEAVRLVLYTFVRSSELRLANWSEVYLDSAMWELPNKRKEIEGVRYSYRGAKMSGYLVPLSHQALSVFNEIHNISGENALIFPCLGKPNRPISENTINSAFRRMGYDTKTEICCHGIRAMACSALNESGLWSEDAIERQMSHQERDSTRAAYIHKAQFIEERKKMMQWWADYLDANKLAYIAPYEFAKKTKQTD